MCFFAQSQPFDKDQFLGLPIANRPHLPEQGIISTRYVIRLHP